MITSAHFLAITQETAPPDFEQLRDAVIARLEAALGRPFQSQQRSEWVTVYADGVAYPKALPVTDAGDLEHDDLAIYTNERGTGRPVQVTYTGGWNAHGAATNPLPYPLAAAIAWGVHTLINPSPDAYPTGIQSVNVAGEFVVAREYGSRWGADGQPIPAQLAELADLGGRCAMLASSYRRVV